MDRLCFRTLFLLLVTTLAATGPSIPSAWAHLAILRQGVESAEVPNATDRHGEKCMAGDFNGDGYDDLAVAAPDENNDIGTSGDHGVVIVSWGTPRGLTHSQPSASVLSVGAPDDFWVSYGQALAVGDFNGDGYDDLGVGAPGADFVQGNDIGQVYVYAGADFGINLAPYVVLDESDAGALRESGDQFGYAATAGDFDGDGYDDLAVGGIGENDDDGAIYVFYGSPSGLTNAGADVINEQSLGYGAGTGSLFGFSLAAGNFRPGPEDDLCVGAPYATVAGQTEAGTVYVLRGTPSGLSSSQWQSKNASKFGLDVQSGAHWGWSLAAGQFFAADTDTDIAIGEPNWDDGTAFSAGRVVLLNTFIEPGKAEDTGKAASFPLVLTQEQSNGFVQGSALFGWSLAAGKFDTDSFDDLAVGCPGYDAPASATEAIFWSNVGCVDVFRGAADGPTSSGALSLDANDLNDWWFDFDEQLGYSVAFGQFDDSGREGLAVGAPGKHYPAFIEPEQVKLEAGQVHIYAPWRQPGANNPHRSALVTDCAGRLVYSQRAWQRLTPASTTKALTAFIATEAMESGAIDPNYLYTVPDWVANEVTGSQFGLLPGEQMTFEDLVWAMISVSGNDAAYSLGDILTGEDNDWVEGSSDLANILSDFADIMDQRAAQLGMSTSHDFSNPAGRPVGNHWTTARDMATFVEQAMKNEAFRDLIDTSSKTITRNIPLNVLFPWMPPIPVPIDVSVSYGWLNGLKAWHPAAIGVKPGINDESQRTAIMSGTLDNGRVTAVYFGHPRSDPNANALGRDLLQLVDPDCTVPFDPPVGWSPPESADVAETGIRTDDGAAWCVSTSLDGAETEPKILDVLLDTLAPGSQATTLSLAVHRVAELDLASDQTCTFGMDDVERHEGLSIVNSGEREVSLSVSSSPSGPAGVVTVLLLPGEDAQLPAYDSTPVAWRWFITNLSAEDATLTVHEMGYGRDLRLGTTRSTPPTWSSELVFECPSNPRTVSFCILGTDVAGGSTVDLSLHPRNVSTSVPFEELPPTGPALARHLRGNTPNPFNPSTTISYELSVPQRVSLRVFDLGGRLVRTLEAATSRGPGVYDVKWNGRDDAGRAVASGVYVYQLQGETFSESDRMVLLK